jgi:hypothetical protein
MERIIWIFMIIDIIAGILLFIISTRSGQDAAGRSMLLLPILLLVGLSIVGYFLLKADYKVLALIITGVPAIIVAIVLLITIQQGKGN